ncbi:MAG: hypothetical protein M3R61_10070, partial [Chloroflexota bacterium]|nr:hypothetical protein [Chloroflexota bacterium]
MQPLIAPIKSHDAQNSTPVHGDGHAASIPATIKNARLRDWVQEMATLCKPDQIYWCDGSQEEYDALCDKLVQSGTFIKLDAAKR